MSDTQSCKGSCLCGAVKISAEAMSNKIGACHCGMCKKWTGGPIMSVHCGDKVSFEGEENIGVYQSSDWAERGFCKQCGSGLFCRMKESNQYMIPIGVFDNPDGFTLAYQYFIDIKPDYYSFANETRDMTEAEVIAKFAPPS